MTYSSPESPHVPWGGGGGPAVLPRGKTKRLLSRACRMWPSDQKHTVSMRIANGHGELRQGGRKRPRMRQQGSSLRVQVAG